MLYKYINMHVVYPMVARPSHHLVASHTSFARQPAFSAQRF